MNTKIIKKRIDQTAHSIKIALYILMAARIMIALYIRVHKGIDDE